MHDPNTAPIPPPPRPQAHIPPGYDHGWSQQPPSQRYSPYDYAPGDQYEIPSYEPPPDIGRLQASRAGELDEKSIHKLIDLKGSLSTIELTLTAITIAVIVLKISFGELADQLGSLIKGGAARQMLDVSIAVGFIAIVVATLQIPRHFTDALIYSNQDAMRILMLVGAMPKFVARCFSGVVLKAMLKATGKGLIVSAILYLLISELAQLWIPVTRTKFLIEVAEAVAAIGVFIVIVNLMVRHKVYAFYRGLHR